MESAPNPVPVSASGNNQPSKLPMILLGFGVVGVVIAIAVATNAASAAPPTVVVTSTTEQTKHGGIGEIIPSLFGLYTPSKQQPADVKVLSLKSILDDFHISIA